MLMEVIGTEFLILGPIAQQVVGNHQDRVSHRHRRALEAAPPGQATVLNAQIVIGPTLGVGRLDQNGWLPWVVLPDRLRPALSCLPGAKQPRQNNMMGFLARTAKFVGLKDSKIPPATKKRVMPP